MDERIEWITAEDRFAGLRQQWDLLATRGDPSPFSRHHWFDCWWRAFSADRTLNICALWRSERLAAVFPLCLHRGRLEAMVNAQVPVFTPLGEDESAIRAVSAAALGCVSAELEIRLLPAEGDALRALLDRAPAAGRSTLVELEHSTPFVDTRGDFADYRTTMKSQWREIERRRRKLEREHKVEVELLERPRALDDELKDGLELEARGWKGSEGTAILSSRSTLEFYRLLARAFHERGELRFSRLIVDGELIAFDLALLHERRYYLLKTAYHEGWRRHGPGLTLRLWTIEHCFESGVDAQELLGSHTEWKRLFSTGQREYRLFRAYSHRPLSLGRYLYRRARPTLRSAYRRVRRRDRSE